MNPYRITAAILLLSASFLLDVQLLFGQAPYYPLARGNIWEVTPYRRIVAMGDTVLYRGRHYSILYDTWYGLRTFERASGDTVFQATGDAEWVKFRFNVHSGDTLNLRWVDSVHWDGTIVTIDTTSVFGRRLRGWRFSRSSNYVVDGMLSTWVVDSLGVMGEGTDFSSYMVAGAVIDGITYGRVTGVGLAQDFYPLEVGNRWNYHLSTTCYYQFYDTSNVEIRVVGDTLMPNGRVYAQLSHPDVLSAIFVRADSNHVYYYWPYDSTEAAIYNVHDSSGTRDTVRWFGGSVPISAIGSVTVRSVLGAQRVCRDYALGGLGFFDVTLTQGIGISRGVAVGDGSPYVTTWTLRGAVIRDTVYGLVAGVAEEERHPATFALLQNFPNPFNPTTGIRFQVPALSGVEGPGVSDAGIRAQASGISVKLVVYDVLGREVAVLVNERKAPGTYTVRFDGSGLASGVYFCRMTAGEFVQTRRMIMLK